MRARGLVLSLLMLLAALPAAAQSSIGGRGYLTYGGVSLASSDTFNAVAGTSRTASIGGGGAVTGLWRGLFVDVAVSHQQLDGQRVFVLDGTVYPLGIPLEVRFQPLDVAAGWRFLRGRTSPYVGAGLSSIEYDETGDFAQPGDDVSARQSGTLVLGGVDVAVARWLFVGGELRYRAVAGILGEGGASGAFDDDRLGGWSYALRLSIGR